MLKLCSKVLFSPSEVKLLFLIENKKKEEEEVYISFFFLCQVVIAKP